MKRRCTRQECKDYESWGDTVPGKGRCKHNCRSADGPGEIACRNWFSVVEGQACVFKLELDQQSSFDLEYGG